MARSFTQATANADLEYKLDEGKRVIKVVKKNARKLDIANYTTLSTIEESENFKKLFDVYATIQPLWINVHNQVQNKKPPKFQEMLPNKTKYQEGYNLQKLVKDIGGDELTTRALSMHLANKIAHICKYNMEVLTHYYLKTNKLYKNITATDFSKITSLVSYIFSDQSLDKSLQENLKQKLKRFEITDDFLNQLQEIGIDNLSIAQQNAYAIKNYEMDKIIDIFQNPENSSYEYYKDEEGNDTISYGMCISEKRDKNGNIIYKKDENGNEIPVTENGFIIDLHYFGQLSVHMKSKKSISVLSNTPYNNLRFYSSESTLLTPTLSDTAQAIIKKINSKYPNLQDLEEVAKDDFYLAYYIATKLGFEKSELDNLFNSVPIEKIKSEKRRLNTWRE